MINEKELEQFKQKKQILDGELDNLKKQYGRISSLRVVSFLVGVALLLVGISDNMLVAGIVGGAFLLVFIILITKHSDVVRQTDIVESKIRVVEHYIARFDDGWRDFTENGKEYLLSGDTVSMDIDLLGNDSLFQMLNVCHTDSGKKKFADVLSLSEFDSEVTKKRREAVEELLSCRDFAVDFEAAGERLLNRKKKIDLQQFEAACDSDDNAFPLWCRIVAVLFPVTEIALLVLWIAGILSYAYPLVGFIAVLSFSWLTRHITDSVIVPLYGAGYVVEDYIDMMSELSKYKFSSERLMAISDAICGDEGALSAFHALGGISQAYNICYNPLIHQILSGIILWDYQLAIVVSAWRKKYGKRVSGSFDNIAEVEMLLSLAVLGRVRNTGWGDIYDKEDSGKNSLSCEDIYHPLISPDKVISNSVSLESGITVITGSNMSGKTTFLRTIAINLALAYIGAPVCGKKLSCNYMRIFTSMRITDDVAHGISTFYAEILRIKTMAEYRKANKPMLCLIDEIFKGTNSADRIVGAKEVLKGLSGDNCMTLVSTHDFELCTISDRDGRAAVNYHFEEYYDNDELRFDYKIKDGRCTTTNAKAILKMAGFEV